MGRRITLLGFELLVADLERAVALFVDTLGFEIHQQGASGVLAGNVVVVTDGQVAITLLEATTDGSGPILPDRTPRFSQLIFGTDADDVDDVAESVVENGLAVVPNDSGFFVQPEAIGGVLGVETAIVVTRAS